jgi:hypothetical protein
VGYELGKESAQETKKGPLLLSQGAFSRTRGLTYSGDLGTLAQ